MTDTATLQVCAGRKITGNGTISFANGTTLALAADGNVFTPNIDPSVILPAAGTATIRIDGARLKAGDHVIATVASGAIDSVALDPASAALDGRRGNLRVEDGKLILNVVPMGLVITAR